MSSPEDSNHEKHPRWITHATRIEYDDPWIALRVDQITLPDGSRSTYSFVDKPDFVLVIPFDRGGFHLVEQYRYPIGRRSLEFPQGTYPHRQDGDPRELAALELKEETGFTANTLHYIGRLFGAPGTTNQGFHIFVASELRAGNTAREASEADMTQTWLTVQNFESKILSGEIVDAPTIAAYFLVRAHEHHSPQTLFPA